jgi:hypothetical protein
MLLAASGVGVGEATTWASGEGPPCGSVELPKLPPEHAASTVPATNGTQRSRVAFIWKPLGGRAAYLLDSPANYQVEM